MGNNLHSLAHAAKQAHGGQKDAATVAAGSMAVVDRKHLDTLYTEEMCCTSSVMIP